MFLTIPMWISWNCIKMAMLDAFTKRGVGDYVSCIHYKMSEITTLITHFSYYSSYGERWAGHSPCLHQELAKGGHRDFRPCVLAVSEVMTLKVKLTLTLAWCLQVSVESNRSMISVRDNLRCCFMSLGPVSLTNMWIWESWKLLGFWHKQEECGGSNVISSWDFVCYCI
jgi:hypothetical protein